MSEREAVTAKPTPKRSLPTSRVAPIVSQLVTSNQARLSSLQPDSAANEEADADAFADRVQPEGRPQPSTFGRGALAVTRGRVISFAPHAPSPATPAGRWLLAHELAHVAQQLDGPPRVRAYVPGEKFHDPDNDIVSDVPGAIPKDVMDPTSGLDVDQIVDVAAPLLPGQKAKGDDADQRWHLHSHAIFKIPVSMFAVPRSKVTLDSAGARAVTAQPTIDVGTLVYAPGAVPLVVLGSDEANVIVGESIAIHYAVGAGSCVLVQTQAGWYMFDAGINQHEGHALARALAERIAIQLNGEPVRAVFLTHGHFDHTEGLKWLTELVQIDAVVANPRQFTRDEYEEVRAKMREGNLVRREAETAKLEANATEKADFLKKLEEHGSDKTLSPEDAKNKWRAEVERRIDAEFPQTKEVPALPIKGSRGLEFDTVGTRTLHNGAEVEVDMAEILPETAGELRGLVDPSMRGHEREKLGDDDKVVDTMSTTWTLTIGGRRLIAMPDLRRTDVINLREQLKEALGDRTVDFQEWVMGHHAQAGFLDQSAGKGEVVSARTLRKTLELLHDFRAQGRNGVKGRDAVIASVDPALVDPAQIRLLRLLGFETYLARSQADVHTYEVMSGGKLLRGVKGPLAAGAEGEPTLQRSIVGKKQLHADIDAMRVRKAALRGKGTGPAKAELQAQIVATIKQVAQITKLQDAVVNAARAKPFDAAKLTAAEAALDIALDAANVKKVVTSSSQLTDTALVLLREPLGEPEPGTPAAEQRARDLKLREQKALVDELRERSRTVTAEQRQDAYAELYAEMAQYEGMLEDAKDVHGHGITHQIAEAEQARIKAERKALEDSLHGERQVARLPDGRLAENKVVRISPRDEGGGEAHGPSPLARTMLKGLEHIGRVMGAVMVISTVRGTKELIESYERGEANLAQVGIGGARAIASGVVGLRMLTGMKVSNSAFVMISVLEIGEAIAGDYDSWSERRKAIDTAVRGAAVNTGCMAVGEFLIETGHPLAILAGAAIMFLGPLILNALVGDDTPEALYPDAVEEADKTLVKLVQEYSVVIGDLSIAQMKPEVKTAIGLTSDPSQPDQESVLRKHRVHALLLESQIVKELEKGYDRAKQGRAGLRELDSMRRQFLELRAQAMTDEGDREARAMVQDMFPGEGLLPRQRDDSGKVITIREATLDRLRRIEASLSLKGLTAKQIHDMDQWKSIKSNAIELFEQVAMKQAEDPDWRDIASRQHDLEARVANARYRLDPSAQYDPKSVARDVPLLTSTDPGYAAYKEELDKAERYVRFAEEQILRSHWLNFKREGIETPRIEALWSNARFATPLDRRIATVDDALDLYQRTTTEIGGPPPVVGNAEQLYREPSARLVYLGQLQNNRPFRKLLKRLEVNEIAARSLMDGLANEIAAAAPHATGPAGSTQRDGGGELAKLQSRFRALQNDRREGRGILFLEELQALAAREQQRAFVFYGPKLGARATDPILSADQLAALKSGDWGDVGESVSANRRTVLERLQRIPNLRVPLGPTQAIDSTTGAPMHISRTLSGIMRLDGLTSDDVLLVGVTGATKVRGMVNVLALNDAAIEALGGYAPVAVSESRLLPATEDDLPQ